MGLWLRWWRALCGGNGHSLVGERLGYLGIFHMAQWYGPRLDERVRLVGGCHGLVEVVVGGVVSRSGNMIECNVQFILFP